MSTGLQGQRILYLTHSDWYVVSHRLTHAVAARDAGMDVHVAATDTGSTGPIIDAGLTFHPITVRRGAVTPIQDSRTVRQIRGLLDALRPAIVHSVATRAVVLGGVACASRPEIAVVNAVAGLGYSGGLKGGIQRYAFDRGLRRALLRPGSATIVQTRHDREFLLERRMCDPARTTLIPGVGVDVEDWPTAPLPSEPTITFAGRLFKEKGVDDFVAASRELKARGVKVRALLAGRFEPDLASGTTPEQIEGWQKEGLIEFRGNLPDVHDLLRETTVFVHPSYHREGIPKMLLEAAAAGTAIVTTDVPGCQDVVTDDVTGLLVPPQDPRALAEAIERALDPATADRLGNAARQMVAERYRLDASVADTLGVYSSLLAEPR